MKELHIYTDGSHLDKLNNGRLGCGGILVDSGKQVDTFGIELEPGYMREKFGYDTCSNPSAELLAVYFALCSFRTKIRRIKPDKIVFHADYLGVKNWMEGTWNIKEKHIGKIKGLVDNELRMQKLTDKVSFEWVKGHQTFIKPGTDAYWNNKVDKLAKGERI